jgi:SAM-dependent methyltransferase
LRLPHHSFNGGLLMGEIFERTLPEVSLEWTGERLTTATSGQVEIEHLHRYFLARSLCRGLDVVDVGSGEGYGAALLAQVARSVVGIEVSSEAVAHATAVYRAPNLRYMQGDARSLQLDDASVDLVVAFETIEHFYEHDAFLTEVRRVLRPGGRFIVSSPDRDIYSPTGSEANPYHVRELSRVEFERLLRGAFCHVRMVAQRLILGSALVNDADGPPEIVTFEKRGARHFEANIGLPRSVYAVAVASDRQIRDVQDSLYIETDEIGPLLDRAAAAGAALAAHSALQQELDGCRQEVQSSLAEIARAQAALTPLQAELTVLREELTLTRQQVQSGLADRALAQEDALTALAADLERARAETAMACRQREAMRIALRRATQRAAPRDELEALRAQRDELNAVRAQLTAQLALTEYWESRYERLRARLEAILRRFGIVLVLRVTPSPVRRLVNQRMLGPGRS